MESAQRYETREKAAIEVYGRSGQMIADIKNLSSSGACIEWLQDDVQLGTGDLLRLTIVLKAVNKKHFLNAQVIWREGKKSGVTFIQPDKILEKIMEKSGN